MAKILVVEDNADTADSTAMLLRLHGHAVEISHDGPTALEMAVANTPDVILLDIGMPTMNGYEVAHQVRHLLGEHPLIIAVTGHGRYEDEARCNEAGIDLHLLKPADPEAITRAIDKAFPSA